MNPWNISEELRRLDEMLEAQAMENGGEVDTETLKAQEAIVASVDLEGVANLIREIKAEERTFDDQLKRFKTAKDIATRKRQRLQEMVMAVLDAKGERKQGSFAICKNGGVQPIEITGDVPKEFVRIIEQPDMDAIRETLANGDSLEFAKEVERGKHLRVKAS